LNNIALQEKPPMTPVHNDMEATLVSPLLQRIEVKNLAVFRALQLGDMLCAVPALRALRMALPDARIALIGLPWAEQFVSRFHRYIDEFITFPGHPAFPEQPVQDALVAGFYDAMRARRFDLGVQMHGSGEISNGIVKAFGAAVTAGHRRANAQQASDGRFLAYPDSGPEPLRLLELAEFLGAPSAGAHLEFPIFDNDQQALKDSGVGAGLEPGGYFCVHPGARIRDKCWSPQRFAEVADQLCDDTGLTAVLTGSAKEADLTAAVASHMRNKAVDAAAPISIGAMAALMHGGRLLICNDTGVSHIAAGLRLPSVVIFSKADMQRWSPLDGALHRCLWDPDGEHVRTVLAHARALLGINRD